MFTQKNRNLDLVPYKIYPHDKILYFTDFDESDTALAVISGFGKKLKISVIDSDFRVIAGTDYVFSGSIYNSRFCKNFVFHDKHENKDCVLGPDLIAIDQLSFDSIKKLDPMHLVVSANGKQGVIDSTMDFPKLV